MTPLNLDMDILRTLQTAQRLGGFNRAADHIGRSQSAVSQQVRRLEEQVGERLFEKRGRGLVPTAAGEVLLAYARRILETNDEAVAALKGRAAAGPVRLGLAADFAETWLPAALARFARAHSAVSVEAVVDRNRALLERLDQGELDLVLALDNAGRADAEPLAAVPLAWIGPAPGLLDLRLDAPVPLALSEAPCFFRRRALAALDGAGRPWRVVFTSPSAGGLWAAVEAGLGVSLRTPLGLPPGVHVLGPEAGLPAPPETTLPLCLHDAGRPATAAAARLREIVLETVGERLPQAA